MRILWVGDAVVSSGFAKCSHAVCDHLHSLGHDIHVLGLNYWGDPHPHPYPIYPCFQPLQGCRDGFGVDRLPILITQLQPDVIVLLNDPWNVPEYIQSIDQYGIDNPPPIVGWLAVDAKNQPGRSLNRLAHVVTWTQFAVDELQSGGYVGPSSVVPLGVDRSIFYPRDRQSSRRTVCPDLSIPPDAYIVGVVGRNQHRKRLDLTLQYFKHWVATYNVPNAYLYLHVAPTGDQGFDLRRLTKYYDLSGQVLLAEPDIGTGLSSDLMAQVYSMFDVYLTTTQGEGWGLPCLEAMSCGVPCIVPDWSGLGSWVDTAALRVPCTSVAMNAPLNTLAYTVGGVPDRQGTVDALQSLYSDSNLWDTYRSRGMKLAYFYPWQRTAEGFTEVLESVLAGSHTPPVNVDYRALSMV